MVHKLQSYKWGKGGWVGTKLYHRVCLPHYATERLPTAFETKNGAISNIYHPYV